MNINRRERLWHGVIGFKGRNSLGVEAPRARIPRVAPPLFLGRGISTAVAHCKHLGCINGEGLSERAGSQLWALLRNPFGIKRDRKALRWLRDQKLSPIPAQTPTFRKNRLSVRLEATRNRLLALDFLTA